MLGKGDPSLMCCEGAEQCSQPWGHHQAAKTPSRQTSIWCKTAPGRPRSLPGALGGWMRVWVWRMLERIGCRWALGRAGRHQAAAVALLRCAPCPRTRSHTSWL